MEFSVVTFYRFINLENVRSLVPGFRAACESRNLLGRILLGVEGVNGGVSGRREDVAGFQEWLKQQPAFSDITFREMPCARTVYHKLVVRERSEIVAMGRKVDTRQSAPHISPDELNRLYASGSDFVIVDTRNDYEYEVGHFQDAVKLPMRTFRDFEKSLSAIEDAKDKLVATYCTGGIRCEKATVLMKEKGFKNVVQLQGGIIEYLNQTKGDRWQGGLFVFDDRLVHGEALPGAVERLEGISLTSPIDGPRLAEIGRVLNYYAKSRIAYVELSCRLQGGETVWIEGRTTERFEVVVSELRNDDGQTIETAPAGCSVTFPVQQRIRPRDRVLRLAQAG